ncbi:MAG TPA: hypothetical protein VG122_18365, partial [Gemmata sp.]|nr:hypothetical protein [Gemmata sp.]
AIVRITVAELAGDPPADRPVAEVVAGGTMMAARNYSSSSYSTDCTRTPKRGAVRSAPTEVEIDVGYA